MQIMLAMFTGLLGTLVGLLIGNRQALGREKRKEFNEVALPIFECLERQSLSVKSGHFPSDANSFTKNSLVRLKQHLSSYKAKRLDSSMEKYEQAKEKCGVWDESGRYQFTNPNVLIIAIEELQKYVRRR